MLGCSKERLRSRHQPNQEKLEQSIPRCKYRLTSIEKLEDVTTSKRVNMSREKRQRMGRQSLELHLKLNKWQWQKVKDYQRWLEKQEYQRQQEKERYERKQAESYWNCSIFRHCWNEGLKLPTRNNCPKCNGQYWEFRQSQANRRSIHARNKCHRNNMDWA